MANQSLLFDIVGGSPMVLRVRRSDGSVWTVRVATAIVDVAEAPALPVLLPVGGQPGFQVQAQLVIDVRPEEA